LLILRRYAGRQDDIAGIVARSPGTVGVLSIHIPTVGGALGGGAVGEGAPIGDRCRGVSSGSATAVGARNPPVRGALGILDGDGSPPGTCFAGLDQCGQKERDNNTILINRSVHLTNRTESEEKRLQGSCQLPVSVVSGEQLGLRTGQTEDAVDTSLAGWLEYFLARFPSNSDGSRV
jgi:hypothetical protein